MLAWWGYSPRRSRTGACGEWKLNVWGRLPLSACGSTLVGRDSTQRVWKLTDAGYGVSYVALPNPQETYYIHKIVNLNIWRGWNWINKTY